MSITAMKLALEALENNPYALAYSKAITSLRQAIEQAERQQALDKKAENARELGLNYEPVPWIENMTIDSTNELSKPTAPVQETVTTIEDLEQEIYENTRRFVSHDVMEWMLKRYYTTPQPRRKWFGLTPADFDWLEQVFANKVSNDFVFADIVCVISAKLKEKNGL